MGKPLTNETVTGSPAEHPAVKAWCQLQHRWNEPQRVEILRLKRKSAVFRLEGVGPGGAVIIAKRCPAATAKVERMIYEEFLAHVPVPSLHCHGFLEEPDSELCWLFLEEARGVMYSPQRGDHRALAARWLGTVHCASLSAELKALLPDRGPAHHLGLLRSSRNTLREHLADNSSLPGEDDALLRRIVEYCDVMESRWVELQTICEVLPHTVVHGDFVSKNVRSQHGPAGPALLVFDWELAGRGAPALDLAQFVGLTVSPDLAVYGSVLKRAYPHVDVRDIQRAADWGNLLRLVDEMYWATLLMQFGRYELVLKPILTLRLYEPGLVAGLQAIAGSEHD